MKPERIAFVSPRFAEGPTVGGAETLLKCLAVQAAAEGADVTFLATCARNHFTWKNELPPGSHTVDGINVTLFPVDEDRDIEAFLRAQQAVSRHGGATDDDAHAWLRHNVNSRALCEHLREHGERYDRIVAGPYLFGLVYFAALVHPEKTWLVPCLHDESFAYLSPFKQLFTSVAGCLFNAEPERRLARRLYGLDGPNLHVVGMGLEPFDADGERFRDAHGLTAPYVLYSGRREPLKGTPLLIDYLTAFRERTGRDIKLVLTGSGHVDLPSALAPHVIDAGFLSEADKHDAMAGALVFCHPSVNESFGIVILESWLAGTPVLVHAGGEVLPWQCRRSNAGLWFGSYPEFEEELIMLTDNPELRRAMGKVGREYVMREYDWPVIRRRFFDALA